MEKEQVSSGNIIDFKVLKRIMKFVRPYKGRFYTLIFLTFVIGVLTPLRPMLIQRTIDNDVAAGNYSAMVWVMVLLLGLLALQSIAQYVHTYMSGWLGQQVIRDIRTKLYEH